MEKASLEENRCPLEPKNVVIPDPHSRTCQNCGNADLYNDICHLYEKYIADSS